MTKPDDGTVLEMLQTGIGPDHRWPIGCTLTVGTDVDSATAEMLLRDRAAKLAPKTATVEEATESAAAIETATDETPTTDEPAETIDFASAAAAELASSESLDAESFVGRTPSNAAGYTIDDVRAVVEARGAETEG